MPLSRVNLELNLLHMEDDKPLSEIYFFWMDRTIKAQRKATGRLFKELGVKLTPDQWIILKSLHESSHQTQRQLAEAVSKDPASITRTLDLLEKEEVIERKKVDRRTFTVVLTNKGKELVERVIPEAVKYREKGIEGISGQDMETFRKVLETIHQNFTADE